MRLNSALVTFNAKQYKYHKSNEPECYNISMNSQIAQCQTTSAWGTAERKTHLQEGSTSSCSSSSPSSSSFSSSSSLDSSLKRSHFAALPHLSSVPVTHTHTQEKTLVKRSRSSSRLFPEKEVAATASLSPTAPPNGCNNKRGRTSSALISLRNV